MDTEVPVDCKIKNVSARYETGHRLDPISNPKMTEGRGQVAHAQNKAVGSGIASKRASYRRGDSSWIGCSPGHGQAWEGRLRPKGNEQLGKSSVTPVASNGFSDLLSAL